MTEKTARFLTAGVLLVLISASLAGAIVRRHDRDDALRLEKAKAYPMACRVGGGMPFSCNMRP